MACFKLHPSLSAYVLDIVITGVDGAKDSILSSIVVVINALNHVMLWTERLRWWSLSQCVCQYGHWKEMHYPLGGGL
jgi:hypothetical protein